MTISILIFSGTGEGMESEPKREKAQRIFCTQRKKKPISGRMAQTPRAGTGNSVGRFRRYRRSTLINYDSNLLIRGTSLVKLISPTIFYSLRIIMNYKRDIRFEFECSDFEHLVISHSNIDLLYQRIVQSFFCFLSLYPLERAARGIFFGCCCCLGF